MDEGMEKRWREGNEEVRSGRKAWRVAHPTATCREIHERLSRRDVHLLQEAVLALKQTAWAQEPNERCPTCPTGGTALQPRGTRKRAWQRREGEAIRTSGTGPSCGWFFPWMPGARAADLLSRQVGVQVREATVRRHSEGAGTVGEAFHQEPEQQRACGHARRTDAPRRLALSADRACVSLLGGVWADVHTVAIGDVIPLGEQVIPTTFSYRCAICAATVSGFSRSCHMGYVVLLTAHWYQMFPA